MAAANDCTVESLSKAPFKGETPTVGEEIVRLIAVIGENMSIRRVQRLSVSKGVVATYMHNAAVPGLGRIGVLVALESAGDATKPAYQRQADYDQEREQMKKLAGVK